MADNDLHTKQVAFTLMVGALIDWAADQGYELVFGEAERSPEQAALNEARGIGSSHSLHLLSLAVDFRLFIGGVYQKETEAYRPLGEYWESLGGSWGGRFTKPDGDHFSLEYKGVR